MEYIPISGLPILIVMVLLRSAILGRRGIKAIVFGLTDKTDFIIIPIVMLFFYGITSSVFDLPFPAILKNYFWKADMLVICGIAVCMSSLVWFGITLKVFGDSFRVGIDESTNNKLITTATFAVSRNPIYLAFITYFAGIFMAYSNITTLAFLIFMVTIIHRQILREEKFLKKHYGNEFDEYCKKVRRYI